MKVEMFDEIMEKLGLRVIGKGMACGSAGHFPVSVEVTNWLFGKVVFIYVFDEKSDRWKMAKQRIQTMLRTLNMSVAAGDDRIQITMFLKNTMENSLPRVAKMIEEMDCILNESKEKPPCTCGVCGREDSDSFAILNGICQPVHRECLQQEMNRIHAKTETNQRKGTYLTGIIGAVFGLAVGILPCVLSIYYTGKIYAAFFTIIPICIYFGYKLLWGKLTKFVVGLTVILSLVSIYVMNIVVIMMQYVLTDGIKIKEAADLYFGRLMTFDTWVKLTVNSDTLLCFLFVAIGIMIQWGQISKTNQGKVNQIDQVIDTVTPNPNVR